MSRTMAALTLVVVSALAITEAPAQPFAPDVQGPFVGGEAVVGVSDDVHRLPLAGDAAVSFPIEVNRRRGLTMPLPFGRPRVPDALAAGPWPRAAADRTPSAVLSFNGIGFHGSVPPDPSGDVGPNHYVQMVNVRFAIYDKSGALLVGPTNINALFSGLGASNRCATENDGDPIVLYDRFADRWLLSQFANRSGPDFHVCLAVSQTPDPTGGYFLYDFPVPIFPDYFKLGVWPDGYYMSTNDNAPGDVGVHVFDRARMLQGLSAVSIRFAVSNKNFMLPSDADGIRPPPPGSPNYFYTFTDGSFPTWAGGADRLDLFAFHADFATPASSTFTALPSLTITAFNYTVCGFFVLNCIPQPSPGQKVDPVSEWPMWRFAYRNMRSHESLVGNFTVDVTGTDQAGIRWFELRRTGGGNWTLVQEGTHAPDANHRFMGSIAMDANGNLALGYSVASATVTPSLRYATRLAGAAPGTLEAEATLIAGSGVQTNGFNRWGDYSAMTVDPADDCTFWYTGEYYASTSSAGWSTRIGAFKIPSCRGSRFDDVPPSHFAFLWVEALAAEGLTTGCSSAPLYCPDGAVTRAEMAVFLVRAIHGAGFAPPDATGTVFADVAASNAFGRWIEQLFHDGITSGCGGGFFCLAEPVTRAEMAVFLLRARHGPGFTPPPATGAVFGDVLAGDPFAPWIERLAAEDITGGCATSPALYCPASQVTRAQMAIFLVRALGLPL